VCEKIKALKCQPEAMRGFEYEHIPEYMPLYQQNRNHAPRGELSVVHRGDATRIIEAHQALRKVENNVAPS